MYKDPDKQREADRARQQRRRDVIKSKGVTNQGVTQGVTNYRRAGYKPANELECNNPKRGKDIKCFADLPPDVQNSINNFSMTKDGIDKIEKAKRTAAAIKYQHIFPDRYEPAGNCPALVGAVTGKPGDADYNGICTPEWRAERGR